MGEKIVVDRAAFDAAQTALSNARYTCGQESLSLDKKLKAGIAGGEWTNAGQAEFLEMCGAMNAALENIVFAMNYMMNLMKQVQLETEKADAAAAKQMGPALPSAPFAYKGFGSNNFGNNFGNFGSR